MCKLELIFLGFRTTNDLRYRLYIKTNNTTAPEGEDTTSHPLVAGCSIGHKLHTLHVSRGDKGQTQKTQQNKFSRTISDIIGCSYQADVY